MHGQQNINISRLHFTLPTEFFLCFYILLLCYIIYILTSTNYSDDQIKKCDDERHVGHVRKTGRVYTEFWLGNTRKRDNLVGPMRGWEGIILKYIFQDVG